MEEVVRDKLMELTPDKWGLLVELNEKGLIDLQLVREAAHDLAKKRMSVAKEYFELAKQLLEHNMQSRSIISRAYYGMYHAARAAVYIQMRLDVPKHKELIKKFEKVLINEHITSISIDRLNYWKMARNLYEYNPLANPNRDLCEQAVLECSIILDICENLIEVF